MSTENQSSPVKKGRGGARPGAGRVKGQTNKISYTTILETYNEKSKGANFIQHLVEDLLKAREEGNYELALKYQQFIGRYVINEAPQETQITILPWGEDLHEAE
jgi:hypothetical protein